MKAQGLNFELRSGDLIIPLHQLSRVPSTIRPCPSPSITMVVRCSDPPSNKSLDASRDSVFRLKLL